MSKLVQLRQKIKSIQTTKKITNAIRQVSMSLFARLEHNTAAINNYTFNLRKLFTELLSYDQSWKNSLLFPSTQDTSPLIIIVSTSKGLCGGLNSNLFRFVSKFTESKKNCVPNFVTIGHKAPKFIKENELGNVILSYNDFNANNYLSIANDFITKLMDKTIQCTSVTIFYNDPKSFFAQKPTKFQLIPLQMEPSEEKTEKIHTELIWEQNTDEILDYLSIRYIKGQIIHILFKALISEHSARFLAMDSSTTNADKYIDKLNLQYNKMRQAEITKEVSSLCAGFMKKNI